MIPLSDYGTVATLPDRSYSLASAEQRAMRRALHAAGGNKCDAAKLLGVSRSTLYRKMEELRWSSVTRADIAQHAFPQYAAEIARARFNRTRIDNAAGRRYWMVDGPGVRELCPKIWAWAHSPALLSWCAELAGEALVVCPTRNAVHVNWVDGEGYPAHLDSNPFTVVAYLSRVDAGELVLGDGREFPPTFETMVFFAGHYIQHAVRPAVGERVAVVVSLDFATNPLGRSSEVDARMY